MPINYYCQIYHRVRLKQIRFNFKVVKHFINQMSCFAILLNHLDEMAMKPFVKWIRNRRTEASLPAIFCLIHFETRNPTKFSPLHAGCSNFVAWIRSRKILGVKLTKRGLVNNQLLVLATYFLQFKFQKNLPLLEFSTQMIFLWLAAVWCRDWDVLVVHEFSFQPMPLGPFRASGRCRNSENREFCAHFPSVNVTKYANLSRTHWSEKIVFQVLTGRICFL